MTAEIAILNRSAVALASDSAVTIDTPTGPKIYESANKLFALIKGQPVGIMIYDSADHLGVPWETIIKAYRMAKSAHFPTLKEYADDFLDFVTNSPDLIPADLHTSYLEEIAARRTRSVVDGTSQRAAEHLQVARLTQTQLRQYIGEALTEQRTAWQDRTDGPWTASLEIPPLAKANRARIDAVITRVLQKLPTTAAHRAGIRTMILESLTKIPVGPQGRPIDPRSGVVIAGFGEREFFPRLITHDIYGSIDGQLRAAPDTPVEISVANPAVIAPFAQREMVDGFMTGFNPQVRAGLTGYFNGVIDSFPEATLALLQRHVPGIDPTLASSLEGPLASLVVMMVRELDQHLQQVTETQVQPILDSVEYLPKDELAAMAESLVNLTSLKRRVSIDDPQTVGGPVDVAVISRGDGFVWIKRKHYFSQELNPSWASTHSDS